jgi:release factor glutamine methyltransferase
MDIGTGSGIIGTSCADLAEKVVFLDISPAALRVAEKNYRTYYEEGNAVFLESDLLDSPYVRDWYEENMVLVANLPYIKQGDWDNMSEDTRFEPAIALFGGEKTGFELYERLFRDLQDRHDSMTLLIEFGFDQREIAEEVLNQYGWKYEFFPDYAGIERFCEISIKNPSH